MYSELFLKYVGAANVSEYRHGEIDFYKTFLIQTDFATAKITESLVDTIEQATVINFVSLFLGWIKSTYTEYVNIIAARKYCREKINELQGE